MKTIFTPQGVRILVKQDEAVAKTPGGIIIPDANKEKPVTGIVIAVGSGTIKEPMNFHVGEKVIFGQYSGTEITLDGEKFLVMNQSEAYGTLTE